MESDDCLAFVPSKDSGSSRSWTPNRGKPSTPTQISRRFVQIRSLGINENNQQLKRPSRRKEQRWKNDNFIGVHRFIIEQGGLEELEHISLQVEHRSWFEQLSNNKQVNESLLNFIEGETIPQSRGRRRNRELSIQQIGEMKYKRIPKRIRPVFRRAIKDEDICQFISAIENVLSIFIMENSVPKNLELAKILQQSLTNKIKLSKKGIENSDLNALKIPLIDSPFLRLLVHAICCFHGLISISKSNKKKQRITYVYPPKDSHEFSTTIRLEEFFNLQNNKTSLDSIITNDNELMNNEKNYFSSSCQSSFSNIDCDVSSSDYDDNYYYDNDSVGNEWELIQSSDISF